MKNSIKDLKGIGDKKAKLFERLFIYKTLDLIKFYPRAYQVYEKPFFVDEIKEKVGSTVSIDGIIYKKTGFYGRDNKRINNILIKDAKGRIIKCIFFNMPYVAKNLPFGKRFIFRGLLNCKNGEYFLEQPKFYEITEYENLCGRLLPIYKSTKGLSQNLIQSSVKISLTDEFFKIEEYINENDLCSCDILDIKTALKNIHFPENEKMLLKSIERLKFDEFFLFSISVFLRKNNYNSIKTIYSYEKSEKIDEIIKNLSYKLTDSQEKVLAEINEDLKSDFPMNRLIQGDVGSGKTIVALLSILNTVLNGYQAALMAPTTVLALQEYQELLKILEKNNLKINVALLTSKMRAKEKKEVLEKLENGEISIVCGTHTIIQEKVKFKNLGLVITDEQHRFGVNQRKKLQEKSVDYPNVLVMSATPIPRTLAWILYGDLSISKIDALPIGRKKIKNALIDEKSREKSFDFIYERIRAGEQAYIICPAIEDDKDLKCESIESYEVKLLEYFKGKINIGILHGQMKEDEKIRIMNDFKDKKIDLLLSTTVIEVGINVENATVIMIENAEKFGLSTLHQLRGRVGRGDKQSYCIFSSSTKSEKTKERLSLMTSSNDGFVIAEKDLKLRGPGDFFGTKQSGELIFNLANPATDTKIMNEAINLAKKIIEDDKHLTKEKNKPLLEKINEYQTEEFESINL